MTATFTAPSTDQGYSRLFARLNAAGLMECRHGRYVVKAALTLVALAAGWAALALVGDRWLALVVAVWLGLVSTQIVFFGHDAGHHQVFKTGPGNLIIGLAAGNLLNGLSFGWWEPKHGAHHAHPNQVDRDPDIRPGAVAFTSEAAAQRRGWGRVAARWQAWTFVPLLSLEGAGLHLASVLHLWRRPDRRTVLEAALMVIHAAAYLGAIFWLLSPLQAVAFIAVHQGVFGLYLGASFAPNHKGMPTVAADARVGFARRQVLTARNVSGGRFVTWLLGGLNYQIEHHLFPKMPMANLPRAAAFVRDFCAEHGLAYRQESLLGSYRLALGHLGAVGAGGLDARLSGPG